MRRKVLLLLILLISFGLMGTSTFPQTQTIRVGFYENPPKIYTGTNGQITGFWPTIINSMAQEEGWRIVWVPGTWQQCLDRLKKNEIDLLPDVAVSDQRMEEYTFTNEYILNSWARIYTPGDSKIETILDLEGKSVGGLTGSMNFEGPDGLKDLANQFGVKINYVPFQNYEEVFSAIKDHEVDTGIANKDFGDSNETRYGLSRTPIMFQPVKIYFALTKDTVLTAYLVTTIDEKIRYYKSDPDSVYFQALDAYFGEKSVEVLPGWVATVVLFAVGIIISLLAFNKLFLQKLQRQTENLRNSELRYRALMENNPDLILRINSKGTILDYHAGDEEILSIDLKKFIGRSIQEIFMEKQINLTIDSLRQALEDHKVVTKEFSVQNNGSGHDLEMRYTASGDSEITAIIRDITETNKNEKDLRESEERYHNLARVSPVGIFRTDADGLTTYVNPTWSRISGLSAEKAAGLGWLAAVHPDDRESLLNDWAKSSSEKQQSKADYRFVKQDGSITYVIGQAVPEYDSEGQLTGFIGTTTDITERKKVEAELQRSMEAEQEALDIKRTIQAANLALSESLDLNTVLTRLLDYLGQLVPYFQAKVILVQPDLQLKIVAYRGLMDAADEFLDANILLDFNENPLLRSLFINRQTITVNDTTTFPNWENSAGLGQGKSWMGVPLIAGGQVLGLFSLDHENGGFFTREYQNRAESLAAQAAVAIQNAELHERVLRHAEELEIGVAERTLELAKRVSEVEALNKSSQELNASLKGALIKAESADRLKSAFLATMSHELRTPLNSIIGFTGILLQRMVGPLTPEQEKQLGMVQSSARHLLELINDVLDISKIEADQVKLANSVFNAADSIQRCVERIRPFAQKKELELITELSHADVMINSDLRRVEQILFNLLNNAVKFTEHGYVKVESRVENNMLRTSITDTGIGIKPEDLQILFIPFQQIDSGISRQYEGTGLGLSICGRLINLLGGEVSVQSKPGIGSTFTFTLPLNRD